MRWRLSLSHGTQPWQLGCYWLILTCIYCPIVAVLKISVQKSHHMQALSGQLISTNKYVSTELILLEAFRESVVERTMENRTKYLGFKVSAKIEALPMVPIHQANTEVTDYREIVGEESAMGGSKMKPCPILGSPSGVLQIHIHYAKGLISEDFNGKSDPYIKLFLNGDLIHKSKTVSNNSLTYTASPQSGVTRTRFDSQSGRRRQTIPKTLNPVFNDIFEETILDINTITSIKLELYDADDIGTDDFLGETFVDLPTTNAYNFMKRYDLTRKPTEKAGSVFVSVIFREIALRSTTGNMTCRSPSPDSKMKNGSVNGDLSGSLKEKKTSLRKRLFKSNSEKASERLKQRRSSGGEGYGFDITHETRNLIQNLPHSWHWQIPAKCNTRNFTLSDAHLVRFTCTVIAHRPKSLNEPRISAGSRHTVAHSSFDFGDIISGEHTLFPVHAPSPPVGVCVVKYLDFLAPSQGHLPRFNGAKVEQCLASSLVAAKLYQITHDVIHFPGSDIYSSTDMALIPHLVLTPTAMRYTSCTDYTSEIKEQLLRYFDVWPLAPCTVPFKYQTYSNPLTTSGDMFRLLLLSVLVAAGIEVLHAFKHDDDFVFPLDMPKTERRCMKKCGCDFVEGEQEQADCRVECHYDCLLDSQREETNAKFAKEFGQNIGDIGVVAAAAMWKDTFGDSVDDHKPPPPPPPPEGMDGHHSHPPPPHHGEDGEHPYPPPHDGEDGDHPYPPPHPDDLEDGEHPYPPPHPDGEEGEHPYPPPPPPHGEDGDMENGKFPPHDHSDLEDGDHHHPPHPPPHGGDKDKGSESDQGGKKKKEKKEKKKKSAAEKAANKKEKRKHKCMDKCMKKCTKGLEKTNEVKDGCENVCETGKCKRMAEGERGSENDRGDEEEKEVEKRGRVRESVCERERERDRKRERERDRERERVCMFVYVKVSYVIPRVPSSAHGRPIFFERPYKYLYFGIWGTFGKPWNKWREREREIEREREREREIEKEYVCLFMLNYVIPRVPSSAHGRPIFFERPYKYLYFGIWGTFGKPWNKWKHKIISCAVVKKVYLVEVTPPSGPPWGVTTSKNPTLRVSSITNNKINVIL
eukprot:sb/3461413/